MSIQNLIYNSKEGCFIVHKASCSYCQKAFQELKNINIGFDSFEIKDKDLQLKQELISLTNHKTFPQIFIKGKFIGGYTELMGLIMTNKIYDMLGICPSF